MSCIPGYRFETLQDHRRRIKELRSKKVSLGEETESNAHDLLQIKSCLVENLEQEKCLVLLTAIELFIDTEQYVEASIIALSSTHLSCQTTFFDDILEHLTEDDILRVIDNLAKSNVQTGFIHAIILTHKYRKMEKLEFFLRYISKDMLLAEDSSCEGGTILHTAATFAYNLPVVWLLLKVFLKRKLKDELCKRKDNTGFTVADYVDEPERLKNSKEARAFKKKFDEMVDASDLRCKCVPASCPEDCRGFQFYQSYGLKQ